MATTAGEIGRIGQKRYGGFFYEEFLKELQGRKGVETYREMADNDDVIGAILFAIEMLIRQTSWTIQPGGPESADEEAAEFIESCMDDMQDTWTDTISEILSFLTYGWSYHEIVYKRRCGKNRDSRLNSKYDDGLIGWAKLPRFTPAHAGKRPSAGTYHLRAEDHPRDHVAHQDAGRGQAGEVDEQLADDADAAAHHEGPEVIHPFSSFFFYI